MKALYRKYRPKSLSDVIGQEQVTKILANALKQNKISHAYLFIGPRGTGKTSVARIFAHEINGFKYELEDNYVDIIEIDGASNRGIDDIRELREKSAIAPTSGKYKVYIIDEVHMLTKEAFNALLKTLEEPPTHVIFIMATTEAHKVPVTITSRAQLFTFNLADQKTMMDYLKTIAKKEKIKITDEALALIAKRGGGSFRDSISLLDQVSNISDKGITKELVISAMGLPDEEKIAELITDYQAGNDIKTTATLKEILSSGIKPETITEELINYIINNSAPTLIPLLTKLADVKTPFAEARLLVALSHPVAVPIAPVPNAPTPTIPKPTPAKTPTPEPSEFNWQNFLAKIKDQNDVIYMQLEKAEYNYANNNLDIYPTQKMGETILTSPNNLTIIKNNIININVTVHKYGEKSQPKDEILSKFSDIMGGEVKNDGGENPFN
ncbi:DNA polymerase III subunit gamma/tau [Candidatus Saccharibacteria bacterium]|nr:DNA polymerase III subunit gamma/tau [Candidatus Saccharibacteria bacterium]